MAGQSNDTRWGDQEQLLSVVQTLANELHQRGRPAAATLDSILDKDLGFDSLSRVELIVRIERSFNISLPAPLLASAETPRDLLQAITTAEQKSTHSSPLPEHRTAPNRTKGLPLEVQTLPEMLEWHLASHPDRPHVYLYGETDEFEEISYAALSDGARAVAAGLQNLGVEPASRVAIMLPTSRDYLFSFFGILLAGCVPVPIYPPARLSQLEDHLRRHARILANAGTVVLITVPQAKTVARLLKSLVDELGEIVTAAELTGTPAEFLAVPAAAEETAFLQYTSGSTGQPKGVVLSHADLLSNIRAMGKAAEVKPDDIFVSWLPLYHDMGLIGAWLSSLYFAIPLVLMSPLTFLAHPYRWLQTIHRHRATLSAAPNFAYELCLSKIHNDDIAGLDLSSWRMAFNGAEPVSPTTLELFSERFAGYGFRREAMAPVYGLAESAVGLAFPPVGRGPLIDLIQREPLLATGKAIPAQQAASQPLRIVACGLPLPGYQIRVVDDHGRELPERREGQVEFQGPSATSGYFRNPEASRTLFDGDWLRTGDLGYMAGGEVYLTSRTKDIIIRGGRNIYPYEAEAEVGKIPGIRKGCVAVFGTTDPRSGTERLILVAESHEQDSTALEALRESAQSTAGGLLGTPPDEVLIAPPHTVLKTSSGKIRRSAVRQLYEQGKIGQTQRAVWWQFVRLVLASLGPGWRRLRRHLKDIGYAVHAHLIFWLLAPPVWLLVVLIPERGLRWSLMRGAARLLFRLTGIPLRVEGNEQLSGLRSCVLVANHSSYLDGVTLAATLPRSFSFIAKSELRQKLIPRLFLDRIGALFVERFDRQQGVADAGRTQQALQAGSSLLYFPEGTFRRAPGLLSFRMGAFLAASGGNVPVVPITIRGTRSILRDNAFFPHHGAISIHVGNPVFPEGSDWAAAVRLRDAARSAILARLDEPDLA